MGFSKTTMRKVMGTNTIHTIAGVRVAKAKAMMVLLSFFITNLVSASIKLPNGSRYPLVGGTRERRFDGTSSKPRNLPENAATPTSRVHAVLGGDWGRNDHLGMGNSLI